MKRGKKSEAEKTAEKTADKDGPIPYLHDHSGLRWNENYSCCLSTCPVSLEVGDLVRIVLWDLKTGEEWITIPAQIAELPAKRATGQYRLDHLAGTWSLAPDWMIDFIERPEPEEPDEAEEPNESWEAEYETFMRRL